MGGLVTVHGAGLGGPDEDITMLTLAPYTDTHVALLGTYPYRDRLKALALYPDLRYDGDERCWLLTIATLPMLYGALGDVIAPMPPGFWLALPLPSPAPVRKARRRRARTPRERAIEQRQAHEAGRIVVGLKDTQQQEAHNG